MVKTHASFLPLVLVIPYNTQYFLKVIAKRLQNFDSRDSLFHPVWIYDGAERPTLNFRAVGILRPPTPGINLHFQSCLCACLLENASWLFSCFMTSTIKLDLASLLKEWRCLKKW